LGKQTKLSEGGVQLFEKAKKNCCNKGNPNKRNINSRREERNGTGFHQKGEKVKLKKSKGEIDKKAGTGKIGGYIISEKERGKNYAEK